MKRHLLLLCFWILASQVSNALIDTNNNSFSDLWEKLYNNGALFPPTFDPSTDPDGDGWTNAQEAVAGTDPFNATPLVGFLLADVTHSPASYVTDENGDLVLQTPEGFIIHWSGEIGKQYTLLCSPDLTSGSWFPVDDPITALNPEMQIGLTPVHPDGTAPAALFWRTAVNDVDSDGDGFTDYEEYLLGTDPEIADSDADGLPDLWEIAHGLDPHDDGPNGDKDHDGYSNFAEYVAGSNPADPASTPPTGGTASISVGAPPTLLTEEIHGFNNKNGFEGFTDYDGIPDAHRRYLTRVEKLTSTDPNNSGGGGSTTTTVDTDPITGIDTAHPPVITGDGGTNYSHDDWTVTSDTVRQKSGTAGGGKTSTVTETLSNEFTTAQLQSNTEANLPAYTGIYNTSGPQKAEIYLIPPPAPVAYGYYISKLKYKWEVHKISILAGEAVNWLEIFTPADSITPILEPKSWVNTQAKGTSQEYEIDPTKKNGKKNGTYTVVPVEFELRNTHDIINGWDSTRRDDWAAVGVGETNSICALSLSGISSEAADQLELAVDGGSSAYVGISTTAITGSYTEFDVTGIKATGELGTAVILRTKATSASSS
ncbi:MAG: hypothetical protein ABIT37_11375 [Luteolibacter sp.]